MASWIDGDHRQVDSPSMFTVHPDAWQDLRAGLAAMLLNHGWTQCQVGRLFNLSRNRIAEIVAREP